MQRTIKPTVFQRLQTRGARKSDRRSVSVCPFSNVFALRDPFDGPLFSRPLFGTGEILAGFKYFLEPRTIKQMVFGTFSYLFSAGFVLAHRYLDAA